jgi:hypothetical protein
MVRCHLDFGNQLQLVFGITRFGQIGDIALIRLFAFLPVGRLQIVWGLQTGSAQLLVHLGLQLLLLNPVMLAKDPLQHLLDRLLGIARLLFRHQLLHQHTDFLQMLGRVLSLEMVGLLSGVPLEEVEVDLRATFDAADKYGLTGHGAAFEQFIDKVNIRSTAGEEQVRLLLAHTERACHTSQSLLNPVPVIMEVQLNGSLIR